MAESKILSFNPSNVGTEVSLKLPVGQYKKKITNCMLISNMQT